MDSASASASASAGVAALADLPPTNPFRIDAHNAVTTPTASDPAPPLASALLPVPAPVDAPAHSTASSLGSTRTAQSLIPEPPAAASPAADVRPQPALTPPAAPAASPPTARSTPPSAVSSASPAAISHTSLPAPTSTAVKRRSVLSGFLSGSKEHKASPVPSPEKTTASKAEGKAEAKAKREKAKTDKEKAKRQEKEAKAQAKSMKSKATPSVHEESELQDDGLPMPDSPLPPDEYPSGIASGASTPGRRRYTDTRQLDLLASELAAEQSWETAQAQRMYGPQTFSAYGPPPNMVASSSTSPSTSQGSLHLALPVSNRPGPTRAISPLSPIHPPPQAVFSRPTTDKSETRSLDALSLRSAGSVPRTTRSSPARSAYAASPDIMAGLGDGPYPSLGRRLPLDPVLPEGIDFGLPVVQENEPQGKTRSGSVGQPSPLGPSSRRSSTTDTKQIRRAVMSMSLHDPEAEAAVAVPPKKSGWSSPFSVSRSNSRAGSRPGSRAGTPSASQSNLDDTLVMTPTAAISQSESSPTGMQPNKSTTSLATTKRRLSFFGRRKVADHTEQSLSSTHLKPASPTVASTPLRTESTAGTFDASSSSTPVITAPSNQSSVSSQAPSQAMSNGVTSTSLSAVEMAGTATPQTELSSAPPGAPLAHAPEKEKRAVRSEQIKAPTAPTHALGNAHAGGSGGVAAISEQARAAAETNPSPSTLPLALPGPIPRPAASIDPASSDYAQQQTSKLSLLSACASEQAGSTAPGGPAKSSAASAPQAKAQISTAPVDTAKTPARSPTKARKSSLVSVSKGIKPSGLSKLLKRFTRSKEVHAS